MIVIMLVRALIVQNKTKHLTNSRRTDCSRCDVSNGYLQLDLGMESSFISPRNL